MATISLDQLPFGQSAVITHLDSESAPFRRKLLSMGVTPGCLVKSIRVAPLGDPIEVEIRGFYLCLRRSEAATIFVEVAKHE